MKKRPHMLKFPFMRHPQHITTLPMLSWFLLCVMFSLGNILFLQGSVNIISNTVVSKISLLTGLKSKLLLIVKEHCHVEEYSIKVFKHE